MSRITTTEKTLNAPEPPVLEDTTPPAPKKPSAKSGATEPQSAESIEETP